MSKAFLSEFSLLNNVELMMFRVLEEGIINKRSIWALQGLLDLAHVCTWIRHYNKYMLILAPEDDAN